MRGPQGQSLAKFETERICCDLVYVSGLALEAAGEAWIGPPAAVGKLWGVEGPTHPQHHRHHLQKLGTQTEP